MSISSILAEVESAVVDEVHKGETAIVNWWHAFEPILEADFQAFVSAMKPIAIALVQGLATTLLSGPDKFAAASQALLAVALTQGIKATLTMANTLIQQIVASFAAQAPAAAAAHP